MNVRAFRTAMRHTLESERSDALFDRLERVLMRVDRGVNLFQPDVFIDLSRYYLEDEDERAGALECGQFSVGDITFVCVKLASEWRSIEELAELSGLSRSQMHRLLSRASIPFRWEGKKKLYDYAHIKTIRNLRCA